MVKQENLNKSKKEHNSIEVINKANKNSGIEFNKELKNTKIKSITITHIKSISSINLNNTTISWSKKITYIITNG